MQTTCAICAAPMTCGIDASSCWCQSQPTLPTPACLAQPTCCCPQCLRKALLSGLVLFGIANCDTVKKARAFLQEQQVPHVFWDFKKHGLPEDQLNLWLDELGGETLINRKGTSWRQLDPSTQAGVQDADSARVLIQRNPSLIKRPLVHWPLPESVPASATPFKRYSVGFLAPIWQERLQTLQALSPTGQAWGSTQDGNLR